MPTFPSPRPIHVKLQADAGSVRVLASGRDDTVVSVRPRDPARPSDVRTAELTRVSFAHDVLTVAPPHLRLGLRRGGAIDVRIELPSYSRLDVALGSAPLIAAGDYGACRLTSANADLVVDRIAGAARITTASADTTIGRLEGDLDFKSASGDLSVDRLMGLIDAKSATGDVRVGAGVRGGVRVTSAGGDVEVAVPAGTATRLDVLTGDGVLHNALAPAGAPAATDDTMMVHVRTGSGDVAVRRREAARPRAAAA